MKTKLGVLTPGQTPRSDGLISEVQDVVGDSIEVVDRGALDGLSNDEIAAMSPDPDEYRLITLLRDGTSVLIAKRFVLDRLQTQITALEQEGVAATLLMCTGEFPQFKHSKPVLQPQESLYGAVAGMAGDGVVGALIPLEEQANQARDKWQALGLPSAILNYANPFDDDAIAAVQSAAARARDDGATLLYLDCFGYNRAMREAAQASFEGPVVLARSMAARIVSELIA